jgi:cytidylate kinase
MTTQATKQKKALKQWIQSGKLYTSMLDDLGLTFDQFLAISQLNDIQYSKVLDNAKKQYEKRFNEVL